MTKNERMNTFQSLQMISFVFHEFVMKLLKLGSFILQDILTLQNTGLIQVLGTFLNDSIRVKYHLGIFVQTSFEVFESALVKLCLQFVSQRTEIHQRMLPFLSLYCKPKHSKSMEDHTFIHLHQHISLTFLSQAQTSTRRSLTLPQWTHCKRIKSKIQLSNLPTLSKNAHNTWMIYFVFLEQEMAKSCYQIPN